jgi:hypothetical protein
MEETRGGGGIKERQKEGRNRRKEDTDGKERTEGKEGQEGKEGGKKGIDGKE